MSFDVHFFDDYLEETDEKYVEALILLQIELLELQKHMVDTGQRLVVLFEGRDAAGKGGAILRYTQHLNPRHYRVIALDKPTEQESSQWYFQRYIKHLPSAGQMVLFDRSWYNRAVVEPALGFCNDQQYEQFIEQVQVFERMVVDEGIVLLKLWFSINEEEQARRLYERQINPLKTWKLSPTDLVAHEKFDVFSNYKKRMFDATSTEYAPWTIIQGNVKKTARLECIRFVLSQFEYPDRGNTGAQMDVDPEIISYYRSGSTNPG